MHGRFHKRMLRCLCTLPCAGHGLGWQWLSCGLCTRAAVLEYAHARQYYTRSSIHSSTAFSVLRLPPIIFPFMLCACGQHVCHHCCRVHAANVCVPLFLQELAAIRHSTASKPRSSTRVHMMSPSCTHRHG